MLPWQRPTAHADFAPDAAKLLADLRVAVAARDGRPHGDDFKKPELWTASWQRRSQARGIHKETLVGPEPWFAKCARCEQLRDWKRELDVDHYRPKALVTMWDGDPPIVSDVPPREIDVGPGYWWLAFTWDNYSLSCKPCNGGWKRNLFPVDGSRPACVEGVESSETPLLLDPGSSFRTRDHFSWTVDGIMAPVSPEGRATIITCGLNRKKLTVRRSKVAIETGKIVGNFLQAWRRHDGAGQRDALQKLAEKGSRSNEFTSMVRWLAEERLGLAWNEIEGMPA